METLLLIPNFAHCVTCQFLYMRFINTAGAAYFACENNRAPWKNLSIITEWSDVALGALCLKRKRGVAARMGRTGHGSGNVRGGTRRVRERPRQADAATKRGHRSAKATGHSAEGDSEKPTRHGTAVEGMAHQAGLGQRGTEQHGPKDTALGRGASLASAQKARGRAR